MSNRMEIVRTKFTDIKSGEESFGARIFDDYSCSYLNTLDTIPDDDMVLLQDLIDYDIFTEGFDHIREEKKGLTIDGVWYDYEEIHEFLKRSELK